MLVDPSCVGLCCPSGRDELQIRELSASIKPIQLQHRRQHQQAKIEEGTNRRRGVLHKGRGRVLSKGTSRRLRRLERLPCANPLRRRQASSSHSQFYTGRRPRAGRWTGHSRTTEPLSSCTVPRSQAFWKSSSKSAHECQAADYINTEYTPMRCWGYPHHLQHPERSSSVVRGW